MELKWTLLCFVGAVLILSNCLNWMAGGDFIQADFDILRAKVKAFNPLFTNSSLAPAAKTMSDELNDLWAPAWNVVIVHYPGFINLEAVLYGYAFNNRWYWQNGFKLQNNEYITFIIWKDFNCVTWTTYDPTYIYFPISSYSQGVTTAITNKIKADYNAAVRNTNDIWKVAQDIQDKVIAADPSLLQDKLAYSIIASQYTYGNFYGRFCAYAYSTVLGDIGNPSGQTTGIALILQMRSS